MLPSPGVWSCGSTNDGNDALPLSNQIITQVVAGLPTPQGCQILPTAVKNICSYARSRFTDPPPACKWNPYHSVMATAISAFSSLPPLICSGLFVPLSAKEPLDRCRYCCAKSCENPLPDGSYPYRDRERTFNSKAGQRLHNYCPGFCSRYC